ncbi:MAG: GGDEF domain-containing protein [Gammaproteobacteria bacterium]|nr:GGDEF domain-containing protein [Gammaproteobacteria bacterium]
MTNQTDPETQRHLQTERLLCRVIIRLALAANGLDASLDPHLNKIRDVVKRGIVPGVSEQLEELSKKLLRADEESPPHTREHQLFDRIVAGVSLTDEVVAHRIKALSEQMKADPGLVQDAQVDQLLDLIVAERTSSAQASPGLIGRLFRGRKGGRPEAVGLSDHPNQLLRSLLEKLSWPGQIGQDVALLCERLEPEAGATVWVTVLEDLTRLISSSLIDVQSEITATEGFLEDLTGRLREIDQHVRESADQRQESLSGGDGLDRSVTNEVGGIARSMRSSSPIKEMRAEVIQHLDNIQQHVRFHLDQERERHLRAENIEKQLRSRLRDIENETSELRTRILDAHHQAITDPVTGLPNRLAYEERLSQEYSRWKRFANPLTLLVWDVDDFKQINDRFGHHSGDKALRVIGHIIKRRLRETDFVARFGGEEFVMLLAGASLGEAIQLANETREGVRESGFRSGDKRVEVTISCGGSEFVEGDTPATVFERADRALYQAKSKGKNRCVGL